MNNQNEKEFANGVVFEYPRQGAPDFVIGRLSFKRDDMIKWLESKTDEWVNTDVLKARSTGKPYIVVNTYKKDDNAPQGATQAPQQVDTVVDEIEYPDDDINPEDIPF